MRIWNQFPSGNAVIHQGSELSGCVVLNRSAEKGQDEQEQDAQACTVAVAMTRRGGLKFCEETYFFIVVVYKGNVTFTSPPPAGNEC